ncbi:MAG: ABC transporter ATP-binding protein [Pseudomonadota bacterium]
MTVALHIQGLRKSFGGVMAVDDVSTHVAPGECVALIGPNGAGKTTLINLISGLIKQDGGSIHLHDTAIHHLPAHRRIRHGLSRTFQITAPYHRLTVRMNMAITLAAQQTGATWRWSGSWPASIDAAADAWLTRLDLQSHADDLAGTLAYGDQKRLELGLALATEPTLLLLDEPMAGVSHEDRSSLMTQAKAVLEQDKPGAILFTEHDMATVFSHADRILVLDQGRLIAADTPEKIANNDQVQRIYLGQSGASHMVGAG